MFEFYKGRGARARHGGAGHEREGASGLRKGVADPPGKEENWESSDFLLLQRPCYASGRALGTGDITVLSPPGQETGSLTRAHVP